MCRHWCEEEVCRCVWGPIKSQCATAGPCCFSAGPAATLRRTFPLVSNVWAAEGRDMWPRAVGRLVTLLGGCFSSWIRHSMPIESIRWHRFNRSLFLCANIRWFQKKQKSLTLHNSVIKICHSLNHTTTEISVFSCCYYYRVSLGFFFFLDTNFDCGSRTLLFMMPDALKTHLNDNKTNWSYSETL